MRLIEGMEKTKQYFSSKISQLESPIHIFTHIDSDGLSAGAILGKALFREKIPFQITILKQLEREEIEKIASWSDYTHNLLIFSDFGSGQFLELHEKLSNNIKDPNFIILDHHLPQGISDIEQVDLISKIRENTSPWHINPYFFGVNGSSEISGAGMCYLFAKCLNSQNIDLSSIAIVGATGDVQNQEKDKSFTGANLEILNDAISGRYIEIVHDLSFSSIKPLNEAIAYSTDFKLPGLTNDPNRTLKFLQTSGVLMENSDGTIKTLHDLNQDQKQKISTSILEYSTIKLGIEPSEVIDRLIVNKYVLPKESKYLELHDVREFSYLLNSTGRSDNGSIGIAVAMGDRKEAYDQAIEILKNYKSLISRSISWIYENNKIQSKDNIQYYFGEDKIPESVIGVIASILVFDNLDRIDTNKPIFGIATRETEQVYKISGRAHESLVERGVNLSEAIRKALELTGLNALGGGHPPAAGTKVPFDKIYEFLTHIDSVIREQIKENK
ncbi:MAG: DHH family phosphoesterase [Candidatus Lokiarchaeota archaeon]|nr:DHH family phosphoesterase [Candidatus Lokiarchaeota archaeon]